VTEECVPHLQEPKRLNDRAEHRAREKKSETAGPRGKVVAWTDSEGRTTLAAYQKKEVGAKRGKSR